MSVSCLARARTADERQARAYWAGWAVRRAVARAALRTRREQRMRCLAACERGRGFAHAAAGDIREACAHRGGGPRIGAGVRRAPRAARTGAPPPPLPTSPASAARDHSCFTRAREPAMANPNSGCPSPTASPPDINLQQSAVGPDGNDGPTPPAATAGSAPMEGAVVRLRAGAAPRWITPC